MRRNHTNCSDLATRPWGLLIFTGWLLMSAPAWAGTLLLDGGRLVDPRTETILEGSILIDGERVARVLTEAEAATLRATFQGEILPLGGRFVMPGLADLHVHSYGNGGPTGMPELLGVTGSANRMLYAGVTAFLDLSSFEDATLGLRDQLRSGGVLAADLYSAGTAITCPGGHGTQFPNPAREVTTPEEAIAAVDALASKRPDVIKLIYIPSSTRFPSIDRATMEAIVARAAGHGIATVAHVDDWGDADAVVRAGVAAITHTPVGVPPAALVARMAERGTAIIPTLAVHAELARIRVGADLAASPLLADLSLAAWRQAYRSPEAWPKRILAWADRQAAHHAARLDAVAALAAGGVTVLTGTDAGNPGVFHGYSVHREMALLVEAGLTPWQALRAATTDAGAFLGREVGLRTGDLASFVVLDASPIEAISHTERLVEVIYRGRLIDRARLAVGPRLFTSLEDAPTKPAGAAFGGAPPSPSGSAPAPRTPGADPPPPPDRAPVTDTAFADAVTVAAAPLEPVDGRARRSWLEIVTTAGSQADPFYAAQMVPGVVKIDAGAGLFVRGGDAAETASFFGRARLAHPFRFETPTGGYLGLVDGLGVQGVSLATGGFSARFGNALSAVLELEPLPPPVAPSTDVSLGLGGATVRWSRALGRHGGIRLTGQRVNAEPVFALNGGDEDFRVPPRSRDLAGTGYWRSERAGAFTLFALDQRSEVARRIEEGSFDGFFDSETANRVVALEWSHRFGQVEAEAAVSTGSFDATSAAGAFALDTTDRSTDLRLDLRTWRGRYTLRGGIVGEAGRRTAHGRIPEVGRDFGGTAGTTLFSQRLTTGRVGVYAEAERAFGRLNVVLGTRLDRYRLPRASSLEPRLILTYTLSARQSLRFAAGRYRQAPSALYFRSNDDPDLRLTTADHWTLAYEWRTPRDPLHFRVDAYTKRYRDLPLERAGAPGDATRFDSAGDGVAHGLDVFASVRRERWQLSLSYSLLDAERRFTPWLDQGRFGRPDDRFRPDFAVPHTLVAQAKGRIDAVWQWSATLRLATGRPFTPIVGTALAEGGFVPLYGPINSDRVPDYQRVDVGLSRSFGLGAEGLLIAFVGINDLFDRDNAVAYAYNDDFTARRPVGEGNGRAVYFGLTFSR